MTSIYIQKSDFSLAEKIQESLNDRIINTLSIENMENDQAINVSTSNNIYVCSAAWENKIGGQQAVLDSARKVKAKSIIVVEEESQNYSIEKYLGGNLIHFQMDKDNFPTNLDQNFQFQLLLSLIQPNESMTASDTNSLQLLKLSKKVSEADVTVFINGPTGTGKEVLSKFIHKLLVNKIVHKGDIKEFELQSLLVKCEEVEKLLDIK